MYEAFLVMNSMSDGTLEYPLVSEKGDINPNGMSFEVRYIDSPHHQCLMLSYFIIYIYNLLGTSRFLIQVAKHQRLLLTTFQ